jgi:hypothetical protein
MGDGQDPADNDCRRLGIAGLRHDGPDHWIAHARPLRLAPGSIQERQRSARRHRARYLIDRHHSPSATPAREICVDISLLPFGNERPQIAPNGRHAIRRQAIFRPQTSRRFKLSSLKRSKSSGGETEREVKNKDATKPDPAETQARGTRGCTNLT